MEGCEYHDNSLNSAHRGESCTPIWDRVVIHSPLITMLSIIVIVALPMNACVFHVYHVKLHRGVTGLFVKFMAIYNITLCTTMCSMIILFKLIPQSLNLLMTCRAIAFGIHYSLVTGGITLIVIAVQRQRSICAIGCKQVTIAHAKILCAVIPLLGGLLSIPITVGVKHAYVNVSFRSHHINILTATCQLPKIKESVFHLVVIVFIFAEIISISVSVMVLYWQIWRRIKCQLALAGADAPAARTKVLVTSKTSTKVFLVQSVVYCIIHVPASLFLVVSAQVADDYRNQSWEFEIRALVDIVAYMELINCVAYPVVYGIWCDAFREGCYTLFRCCRSIKKRPVPKGTFGVSDLTDTV